MSFHQVVTAVHVFFVNALGATHFNTLVRFVSDQSLNYPTRKTVTISWQEEKIFLDVLWKKNRFYPFRENVLHGSVILCSMLFLVIILWYKPFPLFVGWSLKNVISHILAEGEISSTSASGNKKLIIRLWVHDRRTKVTITVRFIRLLFPVEVTGYTCMLECIHILK